MIWWKNIVASFTLSSGGATLCYIESIATATPETNLKATQPDFIWISAEERASGGTNEEVVDVSQNVAAAAAAAALQ